MSLIIRLAVISALLCSTSMAIADEHEAACVKETVNEKGWSTFESVPCQPGQQKTVEQIHRDEEAALKHKCGKDHGAIRIGMTIKRLEECTGAVYVTETTSKSGVTKTYRTTFDLVQVKGGRVVSYTRRTDN